MSNEAASSQERRIFDQAIDLAPAEREPFVRQACGADEILYQRLLDLLAAHDVTTAYLSGAPRRTIGIQIEDPPEEQPGATIGRYRLLERVGEGGCGTVYVAEQKEPVRRRVAFKIIKLGMDTKSVVARFEAERQALAMMDHPNIAKVFDAGATERGRPFFVMELVRGIPITHYCDQNNLNTHARLELFIKVCHAIQHAHQKGIIHRDIKPSNILVTVNDGQPVPKVIDFGIAKATEGKITDATIYTQLHQFMGTPAYMSPEQAEMTSLDIDTRSDIYSLGVLLYELLAGRPPFDPRELMAIGLDEMRRTIREEEPARPSTKLATLLGDELSTTAKRRSTLPPTLVRQLAGDLDWIAMKCLEKDRTRRYETANGLAADLRRHLNNELVLARPPSTAYRFQKTCQRNKTAFAVAALFAVVLVFATTFSAWQARIAKAAGKKTSDTLALVTAERDAKDKARTEAETISKFLTEAFQSPDPSRDGRTITVAEMLGKAALKLDTDLAAQPAQRAKLQDTLATTYLNLGLADAAVSLREKVRDYYVAAFGPEHPDTLPQIRALAICYYQVGRRDEALKLREALLPLIRKVLGPENWDTLAAMHDLAGSWEDAGRLDEALKLQEELLPLVRKVLGPEHRATLKCMGTLAIIYYAFGRHPEALKLQEEVLSLCRKVLGPEHPDTLKAISHLTASYTAVGRHPEALKLQDEVLALSRKVNGPEHPETLFALYNLAQSYFPAGRKDEAIKLQEEMLALSRKVNGPKHPDTLSAMHQLAFYYFYVGRKDEALKLQEELLPLQREVSGPEHPGTIAAMHVLTTSYQAAGRLPEAIKLAEEVLLLSRKVLGPELPRTIIAMHLLTTSYQAAGRLPEATKLAEEVLPLSRKVLGPDHPDTIGAMNLLTTSYQAAGRLPEALKLQEELLPFSRKALADARTRLPKDSPALAGQLAQISQTLLVLKAWAEAEPLLREALTIREKKEPDDWRTFNTRSMLGEALLGQNKLAEAEPLLMGGYKGLKDREVAITTQGRFRLLEALERLVKLHEAKGSESEAAAWRGRLEAARAQAKKPDNLKP
jgi:eukaryotic-like serine/threonine-protein kinase